MHSKWQSKKTILSILLINTLLLAGVTAFCLAMGDVFTRFDFSVLDVLYRKAVHDGRGPALSPQIVYVLITDDTYDHFDTNVVDRTLIAQLNQTLATYNPQAVIYDIMFTHKSMPEADAAFAASLTQLGNVYLPTAFRQPASDQPQPFHWKTGAAYDRLRSEYLKKPIEHGHAAPFSAAHAITQYDAFARAAWNSGNISIFSSDRDGVYRHAPVLIKVDTAYFPSLALAAFLDYVRVPFEQVIVHWGHTITIPQSPGSFIDRDVVIPIDTHGRVFIPYAQPWKSGFEKMTVQDFFRYSQDPSIQGNLTAFFEGKFVFIGDVSTGISDLGHTPLEDDTPLLVVHTSLLNALLNNTFYYKWPFWRVLALIGGLSLLLCLSIMLKSSRVLYGMGALLVGLIPWFTWMQFQHFMLAPVITIGGSFFVLFLGLLISLYITVTKDQAFIRDAFSKFVHEKVVDELLANPALLRLGGEERVLTVLFSDIAGFTSISERMAPPEVVSWLNDYLTEMTEIVVAEEGMIDKYIGDGVMAEFGAPLALSDHADRAVRAGLRMQRRLKILNNKWQAQGLPQIQCRIGINTGPMVVGNLGSRQVFNYTVTGDAVNLAARLESANKQYHTVFMISEFTYALLTPGVFRTRLLDVVKVKGREHAKPVKVFEVYGDMSEMPTPAELAYYHAYQTAFTAYLQGHFAAAHAQFTMALSWRPQDAATTTMLERLRALEAGDMPAEWDGSVSLELK